MLYTSFGHWEAEGNCLRAALQRCGQCRGPDRCIVSVVSLFKVKGSQFSTSTQTRQETVTAEEHVIRFEGVNGYVTVRYDGWWWLGMVTSQDQREREVAFDFLIPCGPAISFTYPERPDNLVVGMVDILTTAHPTTATCVSLKYFHLTFTPFVSISSSCSSSSLSSNHIFSHHILLYL